MVLPALARVIPPLCPSCPAPFRKLGANGISPIMVRPSTPFIQVVEGMNGAQDRLVEPQAQGEGNLNQIVGFGVSSVER